MKCCINWSRHQIIWEFVSNYCTGSFKSKAASCDQHIFLTVLWLTLLPEPLLDLACLMVSCRLAKKSPEEVSSTISIPQLSRDEENALRNSHPWVFLD